MDQIIGNNFGKTTVNNKIMNIEEILGNKISNIPISIRNIKVMVEVLTIDQIVKVLDLNSKVEMITDVSYLHDI